MPLCAGQLCLIFNLSCPLRQEKRLRSSPSVLLHYKVCSIKRRRSDRRFRGRLKNSICSLICGRSAYFRGIKPLITVPDQVSVLRNEKIPCTMETTTFGKRHYSAAIADCHLDCNCMNFDWELHEELYKELYEKLCEELSLRKVYRFTKNSQESWSDCDPTDHSVLALPFFDRKWWIIRPANSQDSTALRSGSVAKLLALIINNYRVLQLCESNGTEGFFHSKCSIALGASKL